MCLTITINKFKGWSEVDNVVNIVDIVDIVYTVNFINNVEAISRHDICQKKIMRLQFWKQEFYAKKRVKRNISQFATKECKCFKMA